MSEMHHLSSYSDQSKQQRVTKRSDAGKPLGNYLAGIKHYVQVSLSIALNFIVIRTHQGCCI
jgi:hypothetical protein